MRPYPRLIGVRRDCEQSVEIARRLQTVHRLFRLRQDLRQASGIVQPADRASVTINGNFVERPQCAFSLSGPVRPQLVKQLEFARRRNGPHLAKSSVKNGNRCCPCGCGGWHAGGPKTKSQVARGHRRQAVNWTIDARPRPARLSHGRWLRERPLCGRDARDEMFNLLVARTGEWVQSTRLFRCVGGRAGLGITAQ